MLCYHLRLLRAARVRLVTISVYELVLREFLILKWFVFQPCHKTESECYFLLWFWQPTSGPNHLQLPLCSKLGVVQLSSLCYALWCWKLILFHVKNKNKQFAHLKVELLQKHFCKCVSRELERSSLHRMFTSFQWHQASKLMLKCPLP